MATDVKKRALRLAARGLPVLPMYSVRNGACSCHKGASCDRAGKHPMTANGVRDASTDRDQVRAWWTENPKANVGVAVGRNASVLIIDIDPRNGGTETLGRLQQELGSLPDTVTAVTGGGGRHLIFKHPAFRVRKDTAGKLLGPGVDVLSDGCIMIAPPSRHASGKRYRWQEGRSFRKIQPAELPPQWLARLERKVDRVSAVDTETGPSTVVREGSRNSHLVSIAGSLQRQGLSPQAILAALNAENQANCSPPLGDDEVQRIVDSIRRYPPGAAVERSDAAEAVMEAVLTADFASGAHLRFEKDGRFWCYNGKLWQPVQQKWVEGRVLNHLEKNPLRTKQHTASVVGQVRTLLEAKLASNDDRLSFISDPLPIINCANGELWLAPDGTVELRPHRPDSFLRHCLDVDYDPHATCPVYDQAVKEIFAKAENPKRLVRHWHELAGYIIQSCRNIPVIVVLFGVGDNGKTKLIQTVTRLLGRALVEAQRIDNLDKSRFAMGSLFGKYVFIDDDVRAGARLPDGILKTISEAKEVTGENKFKPTFNFVVRAVPVLLCNNVPSLADLSHGMKRRLQVIPFDRIFTREDKDATLFERIWATELPGILNRFLHGYQELVARRLAFKLPVAVREATDNWIAQANPLPAFIDSRCVKGPDKRCWMQHLYPAYKAWAQQAGYTMVQNQLTFRRNLQHLGFKVTHGNKGDRVKGLDLSGGF
jgi:P4 family phage/plasmid primase-like protien